MEAVLELGRVHARAAIVVLGLTMLILTAAVIILANRILGFSGGARLRNN